jgi:hypothetical protein
MQIIFSLENTKGPKRRWEDNIRMNVKEIGWEGVG